MTQYYGKTKHGRVWHRPTWVGKAHGGYLIGWAVCLKRGLANTVNGDTITTKLPPGARKCRRCWRG